MSSSTSNRSTNQNREASAGHNETALVVHEVECMCCRHKWLPRLPGRPVRCPNCGSATWDTGPRRIPRARQLANGAARRNADRDETTVAITDTAAADQTPTKKKRKP